MITVNSEYLPERLKQGIHILEAHGLLQDRKEGVALYATRGVELSIDKTEQAVSITYDIEPHFYMALVRGMEMSNGKHSIETKAKRLGFMVDCSRNGVAKPEMVKNLICVLVMAGYDYLELYTEDTYELPGEPYFGHGRGRYSAEELKEIVAFADEFSFDMVPCIQTLAHLKRLANWQVYADHMDIDDILLVGDERTHQLIRKCLRFCKEIFHTERINIGLDEAYRLGRGQYTDVYGYKSTHEVYLEHMRNVFAICKEEGFKPEFWADFFYDTDLSDEEVHTLLDGEQLPIVWKYNYVEAENARRYMKKVKSYSDNVMYAGGLFKWHGYAPDNALSERSIDALFGVAFDYGIDDFLMTAWGNDGDECSVYAIMPSLWYAAHKLYPCSVDISKVIQMITGYDKEEWKICDKLNYVMPQLDQHSNAAKYLLYNDFLIGLLDYHVPEHAGKIYEDLLPQFTMLSKRDSQFSYLFSSYEALCRVLSRKATYGKRLHKAYQENDRKAMKDLIVEIQLIKKDLQDFMSVYRQQWMKERKGFGFEMIDVRVGGLISRVETVTSVLNDYLDGKTDIIYELQAERQDYWCGYFKGDGIYAPLHGVWANAYTTNIVVYP